MKAVILYGEVSKEANIDEIDIFIQVDKVSKALSCLGYEPVSIPFLLEDTGKTIKYLKDISPLFIFNLVEAIKGQGQLIHIAPTILEYLKIPYTGSNSEAIYLTSNKILSKTLLKKSGIKTPPWFLIKDVLMENYNLEPPYILKSIWEHASIGLEGKNIILKKEQLIEEMRKRYENKDKEYFIESYIDGREFNISILEGKDGPELLPYAEMQFIDYPDYKPKILCYKAKWDYQSFEYHHTLRKFNFTSNDITLLDKLKHIAIECWNLFKLSGYCRIDFRIDNKGNPWVLEVNINPCLSPGSGFIASAEKAGLTFNNVIEKIIDAALSEKYIDETECVFKE